ncbi:hypothetical protein [Chitinimonas taiwanensis]|uniref:Uncharacterized protein n=1 Tax=Chitinimonas taiwanensis DSM 18899 TaxID=1121279 RepID=A0A1K2HMH0_9NEIS|nr:hypothetical protein [Chitinimonas taiwanensis]SFZ78004.1 hypothetical protein SAMN02745887_02711 [Chitinimonas taiwanensis DSM 18899]
MNQQIPNPHAGLDAPGLPACVRTDLPAHALPRKAHSLIADDETLQIILTTEATQAGCDALIALLQAQRAYLPKDRHHV